MTTIIYKNIRNGYARVDKEGNLVITIPQRMKNNEKFKDLLLGKGETLLARYKKKQHIQTSDHESVMLFGERIPIADVYKQHKAQGIRFNAGRNNHETYTMQHTTKLLKAILEEYSLPILHHYSEKLGIKYRKLTIRKTSSKRGSCTSDQNISLNLQLVHLPTKYIKYVIIHEACHLKIKNHSKRFRELVEKHCPNYKLIKKEMRGMIVR